MKQLTDAQFCDSLAGLLGSNLIEVRITLPSGGASPGEYVKLTWPNHNWIWAKIESVDDEGNAMVSARFLAGYPDEWKESPTTINRGKRP